MVYGNILLMAESIPPEELMPASPATVKTFWEVVDGFDGILSDGRRLVVGDGDYAQLVEPVDGSDDPYDVTTAIITIISPNLAGHEGILSKETITVKPTLPMFGLDQHPSRQSISEDAKTVQELGIPESALASRILQTHPIDPANLPAELVGDASPAHDQMQAALEREIPVDRTVSEAELKELIAKVRVARATSASIESQN